MCLIFDRTEPTHCGERTVWKILQFYSGELRSRYFRECVWKPGLNCSARVNQQLTEAESRRGTVEIGFHVYTTKERAEETIRHLDCITVQMTVHSDDFVVEMTEWGEAVYAQATVTQEEYARVMHLYLP